MDFGFRLESMVSVHRAHVHERDDMASKHEMSETNIEKCTGSKGDLEEQYRFFQEMRGYVRDLVECLNEKVGPQLIICAWFLVLIFNRGFLLWLRVHDYHHGVPTDLNHGFIGG